MKTTEIKVGTDYAYSHNNYSSRSKVHVLETGVERKEGWRSSAKTVRNGVRVRHENGAEGVVASREIREEWAPYTERLRLEREARESRKARERQEMAENARQAKVLDDYLAGHGEPARTVQIFSYRGEREALEAAGFEVITADGSHVAVKTRIRSIKSFVKDGTVEVADLRPVLADLGHRLPKGA